MHFDYVLFCYSYFFSNFPWHCLYSILLWLLQIFLFHFVFFFFYETIDYPKISLPLRIKITFAYTLVSPKLPCRIALNILMVYNCNTSELIRTEHRKLGEPRQGSQIANGTIVCWPLHGFTVSLEMMEHATLDRSWTTTTVMERFMESTQNSWGSGIRPRSPSRVVVSSM